MQASLKQCRFCLDDAKEEELLTPCKCEGTARFVHEACLRQWQVEAPSFANASVCQVCRTEFSIKPLRERPAPSNQGSGLRIASRTTAPLFDAVSTNPNYDRAAANRLSRTLQENLKGMISPGCLVVQTHQRAARNALALRSDQEFLPGISGFFEAVVAARLAHWYKGIYLLGAIWPSQATDGSNAVIGVNLAGATLGVVGDTELERLKALLPSKPVIGIVGGPIRPDRLLALVPFQGQLAGEADHVRLFGTGTDTGQAVRVASQTMFGEVRHILQVLTQNADVNASGAIVFQGHAVWSSQQLVSEVALGSWSLTRVCPSDLAFEAVHPSTAEARWSSMWDTRAMVPSRAEVPPQPDRGRASQNQTQAEAATSEPSGSTSMGCSGSGRSCVIS